MHEGHKSQTCNILKLAFDALLTISVYFEIWSNLFKLATKHVRCLWLSDQGTGGFKFSPRDLAGRQD